MNLRNFLILTFSLHFFSRYLCSLIDMFDIQKYLFVSIFSDDIPITNTSLNLMSVKENLEMRHLTDFVQYMAPMSCLIHLHISLVRNIQKRQDECCARRNSRRIKLRVNSGFKLCACLIFS